MRLPSRWRTAGLVLAALALPVVLASATWALTGGSLGGTVELDGDVPTDLPAPVTTLAPPATIQAPPATAPEGATSTTVCDEPGDDRCGRGDDDHGGPDDDDHDADDGRGRGRGRGGDD